MPANVSRLLIQPATLAALLASAACGMAPAYPTYQPPAPSERHADVKVRTRYLTRPYSSTQHIEQVFIDGKLLPVRHPEQSSNSPAARVTALWIGEVRWDFRTWFTHTVTRTVTHTKTVSETYTCGYGNNYRTCTRPRTVTETSTVTDIVTDAYCEATFLHFADPGEAYRVSFTYSDAGVCSVVCVREIDRRGKRTTEPCRTRHNVAPGAAGAGADSLPTHGPSVRP